MLAITPSVEAPWVTNGPSSSKRSSSASLVTISWAHFNPGRFHAFEADVAVTVWPAVTSDSEAYGTCSCPGNTSGAWISSENTRPP